MKKILQKIHVMALALALLFVAGVPAAVSAAPADDACAGIVAAGGTCDRSQGEAGFSRIIRTVISVLSIIVGAIAVIMIIIGGFRYVLSGGDSNATKGAKDTIMYAVIGLVVALFAQAIVAFVLDRGTAPPTSGDSEEARLSGQTEAA